MNRKMLMNLAVSGFVLSVATGCSGMGKMADAPSRAAGKPAVAGAGMLAQSRQEVFLKWNRVTRVKYKPNSCAVLLRGGWTESIALFCTAENYEQVEAFVHQNIPLPMKGDNR